MLPQSSCPPSLSRSHSLKIKRAIISLSDKTGLGPLAEALAGNDVHMIASGGTASHIKNMGFTVTDVSHYTGVPEIMNGRVKTLHPKVHGAILGCRDTDAEEMGGLGIEGIDLVVVNLYPFAEVSQDQYSSVDRCVEHIDIGGPTLIRAAAKNYQWVTVLVDPHDYLTVVDNLPNAPGAALRLQLAARAFACVAAYDKVVASWLKRQSARQQAACGYPERSTLRGKSAPGNGLPRA